MVNGPIDPLTKRPSPARVLPPWATWFAWAWVALAVAAALAESLGLVDLRLALDFQRHL